MTDNGAVIRAIKMGFADSIIIDTLSITQGTLDLIKADYNNLKHNFDMGKRYDDTAALLMKDPADVWYAYHVFESDQKVLEQEILGENEGKPRAKPPHVSKKKIGVEGVTGTAVVDKPEPENETPENETGDETPLPKGKKKGVTKESIKKAPKKDKIGDALTEEAEAPASAVLMEDAGRIAKELSEKRQQIGKYVMDTMDLAARQFGYKDIVDFLGFIYQHFLNNYGKAEQKDKLIQELVEANNILIETLSERNRRAFIARQVDAHVFETMERGHPVATGNLLAYAEFLEKYYKRVDTDSLLEPQQGVEIDGKITR